MLKHRIVIFPGHDPDVATDKIKPDFRGLTWWCTKLPDRPWLLVNQESGYLAAVDRGDHEDDVMAIACTVMDIGEELVPRQGEWGKMWRTRKDTHFLTSYEIPLYVLNRLALAEDLIAEHPEEIALSKAVDRMNKTEPIEINGEDIIPEDGLATYLTRIQDAFNDYVEHTNVFVWLWDLITKKRPWMEPDYKMRGKRPWLRD